MFYKDLTNTIINLFSRYEGVNCVRYQDDMLNNAQNNHKPVQVYIDDSTHSRLNRTESEFIVQYNIVALKLPRTDKKETILDIQDYCYQMFADFIARLDTADEYRGILQVWDYSIMTVSHLTDDDASGARLTLELRVANPADRCKEWSDEQYEEPEEQPITIDEKAIGDIKVNPVKLPKNPIKC